MADQLPIRLLTNGEYARFQTGDTVAVANGGTGATTASGARTNLGLAIGTDVQGWSARLDAIAALTGSGLVVQTASSTYANRTLSGNAGRIAVTNGDGVSGNPSIDLATVTDSGTGTFKKITVDSYGRVTGTTAVVAGDITALVDSTYVNVSGDTMTGFLTLNADPTSSLHAATKQYVDAVATAGTPPWAAVRVLSTANVNIASPGTSSFDGVTLSNGERIALVFQSTGSENGIYVFNGSGSAMTRTTDADQAAEFTPGRTFWVNEGTTYGDTAWTFINDVTPTLGSTALNFTQTSGLGQITAGAGLTKTGNVLNIGTAATTRIVVNADNLDLGQPSIGGLGATSGVTKVTVDVYGRVVNTAAATASDVGAQPSDAGLSSLAALTGGGIVAATATDSFIMRTLTGTAGRLTVTNGDGIAGNPTFDLATSGITPGTYNSITFDSYGRATSGANVAPNVLSLQNGEASSIAIGRAVYTSGTGQVKLANANAAGTRLCVGLVYDTSIASSASGNIAIEGIVTATTGQWDSVTGQSGGLTSGSTYFVSNVTNGALTTTAPTSGYVIPIGVALSSTQMELRFGPITQL